MLDHGLHASRTVRSASRPWASGALWQQPELADQRCVTRACSSHRSSSAFPFLVLNATSGGGNLSPPAHSANCSQVGILKKNQATTTVNTSWTVLVMKDFWPWIWPRQTGDLEHAGQMSQAPVFSSGVFLFIIKPYTSFFPYSVETFIASEFLEQRRMSVLTLRMLARELSSNFQ